MKTKKLLILFAIYIILNFNISFAKDQVKNTENNLPATILFEDKLIDVSAVGVLSAVKIIVTTENKKQYQGTGFFVSENGLIMTAKHAVEIKKEPKNKKNDTDEKVEFEKITTIEAALERESGDEKILEYYAAKLIKISNKYDVALLQIEKSGCKYLKFVHPEYNARLGQLVVIVGYPNTAYLHITFGMISSIDKEEHKLISNTAINFGSSGSPVLNLDGKLVGMTIAMYSDSYGRFSICLDSKTLQTFLDEYLNEQNQKQSPS